MSEATLYIDGRWVAPRRGERFCSFDPASGESIVELSAAGEQDVDLAVQAARRAFERGWRQTPGSERAAYLEALAANLELRREDLAVLEVRDNGKPLAEAQADVAGAIDCFRRHAELARALDGRQARPLDAGALPFSCQRHHAPVGVVGQIIPWSHPLLMLAWKVAPALAAGATCVLQPSEHTPLAALELGVAASRVELPPGVLNILPGLRAKAGRALARHPQLDALGPGGPPPGLGLITPTTVDLHAMGQALGGKALCVAFADADLDATVDWILAGCLRNQGQVRSAISRLVVERCVAESLLERLVEGLRAVRIGSGLEPGVQLGPLVSSDHRRKVMSAVIQGRQAGHLLVGGKRPDDLCAGHFIEPTLFDEPDLRSALWREPVFGPVLCVKRFASDEEALALANAGGSAPAASVMSADLVRAQRVAEGLRAEVVWINCVRAAFDGTSPGLGPGGWGLEGYLGFKQVNLYQGGRDGGL